MKNNLYLLGLLVLMYQSMSYSFQVITVAGNNLLADSIATMCDVPLHNVPFTRFADGETTCFLPEESVVQGEGVVIVHGTHAPVHDHLMQLLLLINQAKYAGATKIVCVIPYFGYARHDKPLIGNDLAMVISLLETAGMTHCVTVDIHNVDSLSSFIVPVENILATTELAADIRERFQDLTQCCLVAPDYGARARVQAIADILSVPMVVLEKERYAINSTRVRAMHGLLEDKIAIMLDDIVDTGGTAINAAQDLKRRGAREVYGYFIHPVLSGNAYERLEASCLNGVIVANTIPYHHKQCCSKLGMVDVSKPLAHAVQTIMNEENEWHHKSNETYVQL